MTISQRTIPPPPNPGQSWDTPANRRAIWQILSAIRDYTQGIPGGFLGVTPTTTDANSVSDPGTVSESWAAADHQHDITTAAPSVPVGKTALIGTGDALMRADARLAMGINTAKGDILTHDGTTCEKLAVGTTNFVLTPDPTAGTGLAWKNLIDIIDTLSVSVVRWHGPYTKTHTQLQLAGLTNDISLCSLPAGAVIQAVKIKHSVQFAGAGITDYKVSVGIVGTLAKYASLYDVDTVVAATTYQTTDVVGGESHGAATDIRLAAVSAGANLDQSTAGSVDVWICWGVAV